MKNDSYLDCERRARIKLKPIFCLWIQDPFFSWPTPPKVSMVCHNYECHRQFSVAQDRSKFAFEEV